MLTRLRLTDFRNHALATLMPGPGRVVLTGDNGAGKTNVLEAISLLAPGRGLRRAALGDMARQHGPGGFGVAAMLGDGVSIATGAEAAAPERRIVRINDAPAPASALAERLTVLWLTPAMDRLFVDAAGDRRRFLDRLTLALASGHGVQSTRYEAAMRERNRLLADDRPADPAWLAALERRMAEHGAAIDAARRETLALLQAELDVAGAAPFPSAALELTGWQGDAAALLDQLARGRARDRAAGRALSGPHRCDLAVTHREKDQPAHLCSTGEQKALLIGIVLAHAALVARRIARAPVLLLDEVAAHLDPVRRAALFDRLANLGQVWMTGTEPTLFDTIAGSATHFTVGPDGILLRQP
ncbi:MULTISPECIES: DNA replication/repair protein RecF [unclassified Sphingomonas]|uniref:DNA replication/repair protein RecF n=1 Tax=unclassified Sphingomonas TaxID=196159 RepID=UPI0008299F52|nr:MULTISPECIES: DNA replication/repair protein RecF [unclassified Sphingomonas]